jgi:hypothetical protein
LYWLHAPYSLEKKTSFDIRNAEPVTANVPLAMNLIRATSTR